MSDESVLQLTEEYELDEAKRTPSHVCMNCHFWLYRPDHDPEFGLCRLVTAHKDHEKPAYSYADSTTGGVLRTTHFFGCNQWQAK